MTDALTLFTHAEELEYFHWCVSGVLQLIHFRLFECRVSFTSCRNVYLEWERWVACFWALLRVALSDTDICIFVNYYNMGSSKTRAVSRSSVYVCAAVCFPEYYFVWIFNFLGASVREKETTGGSVDCNLQPNHSMPLNPADWTSQITWLWSCF